MHQEIQYVNSAIKQIENLVREVELNQIYTGTVKRIEAYGVFVELWPGTEGLCHISKLSKERVAKCEDVVSVGDSIIVKCIKINDKGQIDLSRKDALIDAENRNKQQ